jgi:hypothetical protein
MRHLRHLQIVATILKADLARTVTELAAELADERGAAGPPGMTMAAGGRRCQRRGTFWRGENLSDR